MIRDQKEPSAALSLKNMTEEEEEMPLADYFEKKGLAFKLKRFLAKLGRKKKRKRSQLLLDGVELPSATGSRTSKLRWPAAAGQRRR